MQACCFLVAGAALGNAAFRVCVTGAAFYDVSKVLLPLSQGCANMTQWEKSWQAQHFVTALKSCGSLAKSHTFGAL